MLLARHGLAALLAASLASALLAHGGIVVPPPPPPPPPPPDPRVETLGRVGSTTPNGPGAPAPGVPGNTGGMRPSGPTTGRRAGSTAPDRWEFWWEANKDRFLRPIERGSVVTSAPSFTGRATATPAPAPVGAEAIRARILPALLAALAEDEAEIVDSAALALARIVPAEQGNLALAPLVRTLDHAQQSARESAALALGALGASAGIAPLRELLADSAEGRRLAGRPGGVEENVRAFAAASLGLVGDPSALEPLQRAVDPAQPAPRSVAQLALLASGLLRGRETEIVPFLTRTMGERRLDPIVRAHAPIALAKLAGTPAGAAAARSVLGVLVTTLEETETEIDLRRSLAVALGGIARVSDREVVAALEATVRKASDAPARQLALIALGEIGGRDDEARRHDGAHRQLEQFLLRELIDPSRASLRPFAALALGIWGRNPELMPDARERAIAKLLEHHRGERNASHKGALALALALLDARESIAPLSLSFDETRDAGQRGYLALSLGLLRARDQAAALRQEFERAGQPPLYEVQLARALGLMKDPRAVPALIARLGRADTFAEVAATAQALGFLRDASAVEPLLALLQDRKAPAARRGAAAVALGLLASKSELPWHEPYLASSNYCARSVALAEIADLL